MAFGFIFIIMFFFLLAALLLRRSAKPVKRCECGFIQLGVGKLVSWPGPMLLRNSRHTLHTHLPFPLSPPAGNALGEWIDCATNHVVLVVLLILLVVLQQPTVSKV